MKPSATAQANQKVKSTVGILSLTFLCCGCVAQITGIEQVETVNPLKCREAEELVKTAQAKSEVAIEEFGQRKNGRTVNKTVTNLQTLQEAEEEAFKMCNPTPVLQEEEEG